MGIIAKINKCRAYAYLELNISDVETMRTFSSGFLHFYTSESSINQLPLHTIKKEMVKLSEVQNCSKVRCIIFT
jgi:hypothetical protein